MIISNNAWIYTGLMILQGVKIGDGTIVAAGTLVVSDVQPYSIVGGARQNNRNEKQRFKLQI